MVTVNEVNQRREIGASKFRCSYNSPDNFKHLRCTFISISDIDMISVDLDWL